MKDIIDEIIGLDSTTYKLRREIQEKMERMQSLIDQLPASILVECGAVKITPAVINKLFDISNKL